MVNPDRPRPRFLLIATVLVLALGFSFLLRTRVEQPEPFRPPAPTAPGNAAHAVAPLAPQSQPAQPEPTAAGVRELVREDPAPGPELAQPEPQPKGGVLRGRVFGPEGLLAEDQPLEILLEPLPLLGSQPSLAAQAWAERTASLGSMEVRADGMRVRRQVVGRLLNARTDGAGRFEVALDAHAREYGARFDLLLGHWRTGARTEVRVMHMGALETGEVDLGDLYLQTIPGVPIVSGRVVDAEGNPVPGATVRIMGRRNFEGDGGVSVGAGDLMRVQCDGRGEFDAIGVLVKGEAEKGLRLWASAEGHASGASVRAPVGAQGVVLSLGPEAVLVGRVGTALADPPLADLTILLARQFEPGLDPYLIQGRAHATARPGSEGDFRFHSLNPGLYALRVELRSTPLAVPDTPILDLRLEANSVLRDPRLDPLDLTGLLGIYHLRIHGPGGGLSGPVRLRTEPVDSAGRSRPIEIGHFEGEVRWLDHPPRVHAQLHDPAGNWAALDLDAGHGPVDVFLKVPPILRVRLLGDPPVPPAGLQLAIRTNFVQAPVPFDEGGTADFVLDLQQHGLYRRGLLQLQLLLVNAAGEVPDRTHLPSLPMPDPSKLEGEVDWPIELTPEQRRLIEDP